MFSLIKAIRIPGMLITATVMAGCAGQVTLKPLASDHPGSPLAIEAPVDEPQQTLEGDQQHPAATPEPMEDHQHPVAAPEMESNILYRCPMDKEFVSLKPGKCPICGMTLIKEEKK